MSVLARFSLDKCPERGSTYETTYAPPATVFLQDLQSQIPTEWRLTVVLPQKVHWKFRLGVVLE